MLINQMRRGLECSDTCGINEGKDPINAGMKFPLWLDYLPITDYLRPYHVVGVSGFDLCGAGI